MALESVFYYTSTLGDDYRGYNRNEFNGSGIYYCKKQVLGWFVVNVRNDLLLGFRVILYTLFIALFQKKNLITLFDKGTEIGIG